MKKCDYCGHENDDSSKFCDNCGERLSSLLSGDVRGVKGLDVELYSFWKEFPILILIFIGTVILSIVMSILITIFDDIYILIITIVSIVGAIIFLIKVIIVFKEWSEHSKPKKK